MECLQIKRKHTGFLYSTRFIIGITEHGTRWKEGLEELKEMNCKNELDMETFYIQH